MRVSVVMTYYERPYQLSKTLESIVKTKHKDFNVVIVDDDSPHAIGLPCVGYPVKVIRTTEKKWTNPEPAYNTGIENAIDSGADIIILQNAECYHVGDVISYAATVTDKTYYSFACFSINEKQTFSNHNIEELIRSNNFGASFDGQTAWYNHPVLRPVAYDFCSAITTDNLVRLNGYDERFSTGIGYGDNFLLHRIRMMGLDVQIPLAPMVAHQWHYTQRTTEEVLRNQLIKNNRQLFEQLKGEGGIKAKHIFTNDFKDTTGKSMAA